MSPTCIELPPCYRLALLLLLSFLLDFLTFVLGIVFSYIWPWALIKWRWLSNCTPYSVRLLPFDDLLIPLDRYLYFELLVTEGIKRSVSGTSMLVQEGNIRSLFGTSILAWRLEATVVHRYLYLVNRLKRNKIIITNKNWGKRMISKRSKSGCAERTRISCYACITHHAKT